jgi:hypothetical protein
VFASYPHHTTVICSVIFLVKDFKIISITIQWRQLNSKDTHTHNPQKNIASALEQQALSMHSSSFFNPTIWHCSNFNNTSESCSCRYVLFKYIMNFSIISKREYIMNSNKYPQLFCNDLTLQLFYSLYFLHTKETNSHFQTWTWLVKCFLTAIFKGHQELKCESVLKLHSLVLCILSYSHINTRSGSWMFSQINHYITYVNK